MKCKLPIALFFVLITGNVVAEECKMPLLEEEYASAELIFTAKVLKIETSVYRKIAELESLRSWKGEIPARFSLVTKIESEGCNYPLEEGGVFLIFSSSGDPSILKCCSRTRPVVDASNDIDWLEKKIEDRGSVPLRDPFVEQKGGKIVRTDASPKALTIFYAVVVGITKKDSEYMALLRDANGKVHLKKAGDRLYDGKVFKVGPNSVTFVYNRGNKLVTKKLHPFPE